MQTDATQREEVRRTADRICRQCRNLHKDTCAICNRAVFKPHEVLALLDGWDAAETERDQQRERAEVATAAVLIAVQYDALKLQAKAEVVPGSPQHTLAELVRMGTDRAYREARAALGKPEVGDNENT